MKSFNTYLQSYDDKNWREWKMNKVKLHLKSETEREECDEEKEVASENTRQVQSYIWSKGGNYILTCTDPIFL